MTDVIVRATAIKWAGDDFPCWRELRVVDFAGHVHRIVEKVPVLTSREFTAATSLPTELWIAADMEGIEGDRVGITLKSGVETTDGLVSLTVGADDVHRL